MVQYKLYYFNVRGRAEIIRLIFAVAGVEYEDIRIPREDWPKHKASMPLGQMPVLEIDGKKMCQSAAIGRYLANKYGLLGSTEMDKYWADMYLETLEDLFKKFPFTERDEEKKNELIKQFLTVSVPDTLLKMEKLYVENNNEEECFFVGKLGVADLTLMTFFDLLIPMKEDILAEVPKLAALYQRIREVPRIKAWVSKRPQTEF